jgi:hypothetical protein
VCRQEYGFSVHLSYGFRTCVCMSTIHEIERRNKHGPIRVPTRGNTSRQNASSLSSYTFTQGSMRVAITSRNIDRHRSTIQSRRRSGASTASASLWQRQRAHASPSLSTERARRRAKGGEQRKRICHGSWVYSRRANRISVTQASSSVILCEQRCRSSRRRLEGGFARLVGRPSAARSTHRRHPWRHFCLHTSPRLRRRQ